MALWLHGRHVNLMASTSAWKLRLDLVSARALLLVELLLSGGRTVYAHRWIRTQGAG